MGPGRSRRGSNDVSANETGSGAHFGDRPQRERRGREERPPPHAGMAGEWHRVGGPPDLLSDGRLHTSVEVGAPAQQAWPGGA